ncbi:NAD(P)H-dependent oxidoreductase [Tsukamurella sp. 1534]|uniref:NAD(P)H-dependent oxidoreductase n=1 Tax=Tsukamurella sp. 1534 TaxID=1151061 RepID=UPI0006AD08C0|nr:NAD(P)H-dependent oxidoreductase [Tsukamurella sp. 1534]
MTKQTDSLRAVVVTAHPDADAATAATARAVAAGLRDGGAVDVEVHDLLLAGFDPAFRAADVAAYRGDAPLPGDVREEQRYLEGFDLIAVVFPVYWWSLPSTLKGWIDRVFTRDWAYDDTGSGVVLRAPKNLHFFGIGAAGARAYDKYGYRDAMHAQLVTGIAGYSGAGDSSLVLLHDGESTDPDAHAARHATARGAAARIAERLGRDGNAA